MEEGSVYQCDLAAPDTDLLNVSGNMQLDAGSTFHPQAVASLGAVGTTTRTVIAAATLAGSFTHQPAAGDHLGFGVFYQGTNYAATGVAVGLFQALAGDVDGNGLIDQSDLEQILLADSFGHGSGFDWPQGDFDGDSDVDNADLQRILATGMFRAGPYSATAPMPLLVPEPSAGALLLGALLAAGVVVWRQRQV